MIIIKCLPLKVSFFAFLALILSQTSWALFSSIIIPSGLLAVK